MSLKGGDMSQPKIEKLTPEQEALIPFYLENGERSHFQPNQLIVKKP